MQKEVLKLHRYWRSPRTKSFIRRVADRAVVVNLTVKFDNAGKKQMQAQPMLNRGGNE
jgi:hypothetical protein